MRAAIGGHARRPRSAAFSLDQKLTNLDSYLPAGRSLCEIRLLSVDKKFRTGQVFQGLLTLVWQHFVEKGYDMGIISGRHGNRSFIITWVLFRSGRWWARRERNFSPCI